VQPPAYADPEYYRELGENDGEEGEWEFEVYGQDNADEFLALARKDELSEADLDDMRGYLADIADNPDSAGYIFDELGMEAYLELAQRIQESDLSDSQHGGSLLDLMGTTLSSAMWVPGDMRTGSVAYEEWLTTRQGERYADRLTAFQDAGQQPLGSDDDAPMGFDVAIAIMERSTIPMDQQFFDQTMDFFTTPIGGDEAFFAPPESGRLSEDFMMAACRTSPEVVDHYLFSSYGAPGTPEAKAQWATDLMNRGE
jgi:hypothetical protein